MQSSPRYATAQQLNCTRPYTRPQLEHHNEHVEGLVDDIVGTYYNGFNKAIHHYSDILVLFTDAKEQVDVLREALEVARKRLGSSSSSLQSTVGDFFIEHPGVHTMRDACAPPFFALLVPRFPP